MKSDGATVKYDSATVKYDSATVKYDSATVSSSVTYQFHCSAKMRGGSVIGAARAWPARAACAACFASL